MYVELCFSVCDFQAISVCARGRAKLLEFYYMLREQTQSSAACVRSPTTALSMLENFQAPPPHVLCSCSTTYICPDPMKYPTSRSSCRSSGFRYLAYFYKIVPYFSDLSCNYCYPNFVTELQRRGNCCFSKCSSVCVNVSQIVEGVKETALLEQATFRHHRHSLLIIIE